MICRCTSRKHGFTAMPDPEKGEHHFNYNFWVCGNCHLPARMVFEKLTDNRAPKRATHIKSVVGDSHGRNVLTWGTEVSGEKIVTMNFHAYPRKADMDQGRDMLVKFWEELDREIDTIRSGQAALVEINKTRASTLAWVLAAIMAPFYEDGNAVLRESMVRWTARQEGREHESPGLAESIWDPATRFDGTPYSKGAEAKARSGGAAAPKRVALDEQKINFVKHSLSTGVMSAEVLAGMFGVTVDDIKAANDS